MEHREAIEYDLLVRTGHELSDIGNTLSWSAFDSFLKKLDMDIHSALFRELNPDIAIWADTAKTNAILADIFDIFVAVHTKKGTKPAEYPRPGNKQTIGKDPVPISKFWDWWDKGET